MSSFFPRRTTYIVKLVHLKHRICKMFLVCIQYVKASCLLNTNILGGSLDFHCLVIDNLAANSICITIDLWRNTSGSQFRTGNQNEPRNGCYEFKDLPPKTSQVWAGPYHMHKVHMQAKTFQHLSSKDGANLAIICGVRYHLRRMFWDISQYVEHLEYLQLQEIAPQKRTFVRR